MRSHIEWYLPCRLLDKPRKSDAGVLCHADATFPKDIASE